MSKEHAYVYETRYRDGCYPAPQQAVEMTLKSIISALWTHDDMLPVMCAEIPERIEVEMDE